MVRKDRYKYFILCQKIYRKPEMPEYNFDIKRFSFGIFNKLANRCLWNFKWLIFYLPITRKYQKISLNEKQNSQNYWWFFLSQCFNSISKLNFINGFSSLIFPNLLNLNKNIFKSVKITYGTIISRQTISTDTPSVGVLTSIKVTVGWTFMCTVSAKISFFTIYKNKCKQNVNVIHTCKFKLTRTTN